MDDKDLGEKVRPSVELNLRARIFGGLPGYVQAIDDAKYLNLKILQHTAGVLRRDYLEPKPEQSPPIVPEMGLNAPIDQLRNFAADSMYYELEKLGKKDTLNAIDECVLRLERLVKLPDVGDIENAMSLINSIEPVLNLVVEKYKGQQVSPDQMMSEAINILVNRGKFNNREGVQTALTGYFDSYVQLLRQGDWWNAVLVSNNN